MGLPLKFLTNCIPARSFLVGCVALTPDKYIKVWVIPAIIVIVGYMFRYITFNELQTGILNQKIWWNNNRLFHIMFSIIFIILLATNNYNYAKIMPLIDLLAGSASVYSHYKI